MSTVTTRASLDEYRLAPEAINPPVRNVMRSDVVFCLPSTPVDAVSKLLADNDLMELPIYIDRRFVGCVAAEDVLSLLSNGDIVIAGSDVAMRPVPVPVTAGDIQRPGPLLVDENQLLHDVVALLHQQERTVAVVMHEDSIPVGMLTAAEIATHYITQAEKTEETDGNA